MTESLRTARDFSDDNDNNEEEEETMFKDSCSESEQLIFQPTPKGGWLVPLLLG